MYKIHNVLSNDERKKLIKDVQPFLMIVNSCKAIITILMIIQENKPILCYI